MEPSSSIDWLRCALPHQKMDIHRLRHPFVQQYIKKAVLCALEKPRFATPALSNFFRLERSLGSKDRRRVQTAVYGLIRHRDIITRAGYWNTNSWAEVWASICEGETFPHLVSQGEEEDFACALSLPTVLTKTLFHRMSIEERLEFAHAINTPPPIYIRAQHITPLSLQQKLAKENIQSSVLNQMKNTLKIHGRVNLIASSAYRNGFFDIQDLSSQQFCERVSILGERFFDLCAGAGGKSLALSSMGKKVFAHEPRSHAKKQLQKRARRSKISIHTQLPPKSSMDVVIIDAPCSGSGRLHRDPALRWRLSPTEHISTQQELIEYAKQFVRPNGFIVYATCSIFDVENKHSLSEGNTIEETRISPNNQDGFYWHIWQYGAKT